MPTHRLGVIKPGHDGQQIIRLVHQAAIGLV
ncbi:Uncharacterised protein [Alcaligenes faecalis]|nr:hypothetical protein ALFP_1132 [Alcaligenes faecalis]GAU73284.1 hypothetical protein AFA2_01617 [Alcaligenes faecalis subsp. faecalis NBRC 13111]CUI37434.1 Uncharacterised protein [Alcaligenes faecalis]